MGPEDENNWLNVSGLESGHEYDIRIVAMNNGDNKTVSDPIVVYIGERKGQFCFCLLYTSPSPRDRQKSRMPSSA